MKIVNTDNFDSDYPNERFVNIPSLSKGRAQKIADIINEAAGGYHSRFWKVVEDDYKLLPGFEP